MYDSAKDLKPTLKIENVMKCENMKMYQTQEIHYLMLAWFLFHEIKLFADPFTTYLKKKLGGKIINLPTYWPYKV